MTFEELNKKYQDFKNKYNGKYTDYDGAYGAQCWDLAQRYFVEYLGVPAWVLSGSGLVSSMLDRDRHELDQYFEEIPVTQMCPGDVVIWDWGHIALFDRYDGANWYFSQNPGPCQVITIRQEGQHAFRLKGVYQPEQPKENNTNSEQVENEIKELQEQLSEIKEMNNLLKIENEQLLTENVALRKENEELRGRLDNQPSLVFTAPSEDYYAIRLKNGQKLYIK